MRPSLPEVGPSPPAEGPPPPGADPSPPGAGPSPPEGGPSPSEGGPVTPKVKEVAESKRGNRLSCHKTFYAIYRTTISIYILQSG